MHEYDKSSKWLIQHHGDSILRLAGIRDIVKWRPLQAELVQPRRLPDGLIEVHRQGRAEPSLFVLEISTYPYAGLAEQAARDTLLVYLDRGIVPENLVLVLHPQGNQRAAGELTLKSQEGSTRLQVAWKVVELWTIPAEDLLAACDVGLIPWVPLCHFDGPPEPIFRQCRTRIDQEAPPNEYENLLAVTQVLAGLRYNDPKLFQLLGGRDAMIESPVLQELIADCERKAALETARKDILRILVTRFGAEARALEAELTDDDNDRLGDLIELAVTCADLESFQKQLSR
jgi:hypothetical protein